MAKLSCCESKYVLEVTHRWYGDLEGVVAEFIVAWDGQPVLNKSIMKRQGAFWGWFRPTSLHATEYVGPSVVEFLRRALEANRPDVFEPADPDTILAVYPESSFPFLGRKTTIVWERPEARKERLARQRLKKAIGKLPDDHITLILFGDTYNFAGSIGYSRSGVALHFEVERAKLEGFVRELARERGALLKKIRATKPKKYAYYRSEGKVYEVETWWWTPIIRPRSCPGRREGCRGGGLDMPMKHQYGSRRR